MNRKAYIDIARVWSPDLKLKPGSFGLEVTNGLAVTNPVHYLIYTTEVSIVHPLPASPTPDPSP